MTKKEHLLIIVAEEAAEISQRACKALRSGLGETEPGQDLTNYQRLYVEILDLEAVCEMLDKEIDKDDPDITSSADELDDPRVLMEDKKHRILSYLEYSRQCGTLT